MKNKKKSSKKFLIIFIIIDIVLGICIALLFNKIYWSKQIEQARIQSQIEQEERRKQEEQERLEKQAQQEEQARQKQERLEQIQKSLPTKFDMRNKIKISVESQSSKPFCSYYAEIKAREIALNYQGNYDYNFKKVYKYLQTIPDELMGNDENISIFLKDSIGFDDIYKTNCNLETIELKNALVNGKPLPIIIDFEFSVAIGADSSTSYARTQISSNWI